MNLLLRDHPVKSIRRGLVDYWPLASAGAVDLKSALYSGSGPHDLTNVNTVTRGAGPSANLPDAASFDDANSEYLSHADNASLSIGSSPFTIAVWALADDFAASHAIVAKDGVAAGSREFTIFFTATTGTIDYRVYDGTNQLRQLTVNDNGTGTWHFIVFGWDGSSAFLSLNGADSLTGSAASPLGDGAAEFRIGARERIDTSSNDLFLDGRIAHLGFWKRVLTKAEITWLYNNGDGRDLTGAV